MPQRRGGEALPGAESGESASILWRRLDRRGHEACRVERSDRGWRLAGSAVFQHESGPCLLDYSVLADEAWNTVSARVDGWVRDRTLRVEIDVDPSRRWSLNGVCQPELDGCVDVDLNFSPSTNLLPIRRLALEVGREVAIRAAWLRFPAFALEPLEQTYRRASASLYRYESAGGRFVADLEVNVAGFVTRYPGFCEVEAASD